MDDPAGNEQEKVKTRERLEREKGFEPSTLALARRSRFFLIL
jgi:hypothetical protein